DQPDRRRIVYLDRCRIGRARPVEVWRNAGLAGIAPIGLPAGVHVDFDPRQERFSALGGIGTCQQPHPRALRLDPRRGGGPRPRAAGARPAGGGAPGAAAGPPASAPHPTPARRARPASKWLRFMPPHTLAELTMENSMPLNINAKHKSPRF